MKKFVTTLLAAASLVSSPYIGHAAKVVVDPGHGGSDPGAIGINGLYEKTVNSEISYRLEKLLKEYGYEVVLTRDRDISLSLDKRVEIAKSSDADLFVSVHANAHPDSSIQGTMVLYHDAAYPNPSYPASEEMKKLTPQSRRLAQSILDAVLEEVPNINRGLVPSSAYVVRMGNIPSVLVETAFLSNAKDAEKLSSPAYWDKYAKGIAKGIMNYLPPVFRDIGGHWAKDSILRLNKQGIANGNNGKFHPDQPLTRAELVAFVDRAFGLNRAYAKNQVTLSEAYRQTEPTVTEAVYSEQSATIPDFPDLQPDHWAYETVRAAVENGVLKGYPDGTIRPDSPVSRAEVAVVFDRLVGPLLPMGDYSILFTDVPADNWAYPAIVRLSASGIVRGVAAQTYAPEKKVTRAEAATMIDRQISVL